MISVTHIVARTLSVVQERSSSKRKEMWKTVQSKAGIARPVQLVLDMKVRWSSTYLMLDRAERNKVVSACHWQIPHDLCSPFSQFVDTFIDELRWEETDGSKRDKIRALKLDAVEWERVDLFVGLLAVRVSYKSVAQISNTLPAQ